MQISTVGSRTQLAEPSPAAFHGLHHQEARARRQLGYQEQAAKHKHSSKEAKHPKPCLSHWAKACTETGF